MKITALLATTAIAMAFAAPAYAEMKIGILVPTTGSEATYGQDMANAVDLAIAEINAAGGVLGEQLSSVVGDDGCDPQQAVNAASKLASSDVTGIVGGYCSGATVPTLKIFGDANIPFVIAAANSTKLIPANPGNAFMINSTGNDQVAKAIEYFTANGVSSLAIVNQGDAYSQDLADLTKKNWEEAGNTVPAFEVANKGEQDYSAIVTAIRSANPDAVFWTAYYADGGLLIRQLRQAGYQGKIAVGDGSNSPELFNIAGSAADGVVGFSNPTAEFLPEAKAFIADYTEANGSAPGPYAPLAYDGMHLLAKAIETAGSTDAEAINAALAASDYTGIAGQITFTPENTLARSNFVVLQGKGGAWTLAE
ncbi:branched-chain amino acid ABC transporter substrate-binding protein [Devosia sp. J2-20]|jgi:branched-chain amino acid transport system substrate-binding protein|uniref:Branched-chain amino acid ABC transporter substrate-binding protein n=1 Tax=Devosia litorisediminis TaxID=2829817 RepID=A0A942IEM9_9HYPH|nr:MULTISPECIES: branched-chain amino acid ABC transporter substrate-binding protein [Devosia]MBS3849864.1 branched-chain amino acid ABC transporter substrate-binding protein [Devosia litorisediminis]MCZ4346863.1 branched-chain amino acid ABC transporter substrate-binding protein [Devosia neptuniae]WDR00594.1 branched-chain amino acid ABC transporter substrate-binding protein [Devosia sp. J2-20]|tara:strand:+ start:95957 stop:97054 length:1098 start_codon:yes stop_codon:yes gene_type:complete